MPSIRDLRGKPLEEEVSSRDGVPSPPVAKSDKGDIDLSLVKKGIAAVRAKRGQPVPQTWLEDGAAVAEASSPAGMWNTLTEVSAETILSELTATLQEILTSVQHAREVVAQLRVALQQDAEKLERLDTIERALAPMLKA